MTATRALVAQADRAGRGKTTNVSYAVEDDVTAVRCTASGITITLQAAAAANSGRTVKIRNDSGSGTVTATGTGLASNVTINNTDSLDFTCFDNNDGTFNWQLT